MFGRTSMHSNINDVVSTRSNCNVYKKVYIEVKNNLLSKLVKKYPLLTISSLDSSLIITLLLLFFVFFP